MSGFIIILIFIKVTVFLRATNITKKCSEKKFFISTVLSIPVLYFSTFVSGLLKYSPIQFTGSNFIVPVFSVVIFIYGGLPFLKMAKGELEDKKPGMMALISLAIIVAFTYSIALLFIPETSSLFWELVTLIDIMLLGHWIEMRSVRQASSALDELKELVPNTAEKIIEGDAESRGESGRERTTRELQRL
ncbi:MAG: Cu2+-exporting ATPase [Candidatus Nanohaloarchaea archaeon]